MALERLGSVQGSQEQTKCQGGGLGRGGWLTNWRTCLFGDINLEVYVWTIVICTIEIGIKRQLICATAAISTIQRSNVTSVEWSLAIVVWIDADWYFTSHSAIWDYEGTTTRHQRASNTMIDGDVVEWQKGKFWAFTPSCCIQIHTKGTPVLWIRVDIFEWGWWLASGHT